MARLPIAMLTLAGSKEPLGLGSNSSMRGFGAAGWGSAGWAVPGMVMMMGWTGVGWTYVGAGAGAGAAAPVSIARASSTVYLVPQPWHTK